MIRGGWIALLAGTAAAVTACAGPFGSAVAGGPDDPVQQSGPITYGHDGHPAATCEGETDALDYVVQWPAVPGQHPVVFGMTGTGFAGAAACDPKTHQDGYRGFDGAMRSWAAAGYVAVNIDYHGYRDKLFGNLTYPGKGKWGDVADGTVQLDIKPAIEYFLHHDPQQYGADLSQGAIAFGASSGAHNAYMLAITGVPGVRIAAAAGWSGFPDMSLAGSYAHWIFNHYMRSTPGSDVENFADPEHRLRAGSPPEYVANGTLEFIRPANAEQYAATCTRLHIAFCYERIVNTRNHADFYARYIFTGHAPEVTSPRAVTGQTVTEDSIAFANTVLAAAR